MQGNIQLFSKFFEEYLSKIFKGLGIESKIFSTSVTVPCMFTAFNFSLLFFTYHKYLPNCSTFCSWKKSCIFHCFHHYLHGECPFLPIFHSKNSIHLPKHIWRASLSWSYSWFYPLTSYSTFPFICWSSSLSSFTFELEYLRYKDE